MNAAKTVRLLAAIAPSLMLAQPTPAPSPESAASAPSSQVAPAAAERPADSPRGELTVLERFLSLSDAELAQMEQAIARVRAMTPEERAALREQIGAYRRLPAAQRMELRRGWGSVPMEIRRGWHQLMMSATPERRAEIREKLQSLPPEERLRYRRELVQQFFDGRESASPSK